MTTEPQGTRAVAGVVCLHSRDEVEGFCRRNPALHLYALGDLDDFFWPHTTWYALREGGEARELVLVYAGRPVPTVLAYAGRSTDAMRLLLGDVLRLLPRRFHAHLTDGLADVLAADYRVESHGPHRKMRLADPARLDRIDTSEAVPLTAADADELAALYAASYPGNWFAPRMLETGCYYGVRRGGELVSVAGVHVHSPRYKVAALGNITTRPDVRGRGLAGAVTARVCRELLSAGVGCVGLNVKADNAAAVRCYQALGFEPVADYAEYTVEPRPGGA